MAANPGADASVDEAVGDARFFRKLGPRSLSVIAEVARAKLTGGVAGTSPAFVGVAPLQAAARTDISFLDNRRYAGLLADTRAGAVILHPSLADRLPGGCIGLLTADPYLAWARVCALFYPRPAVRPGRHPSAVIDNAAAVDASAEIGPFALIGAGAVVGPGCLIEAHASIGAGVVLGADCAIGPSATVSHAILGKRVRILPGARIGQEGFGFAPDGAGGYLTVPQLGRVIIGDDVEIGANSCIDRGSMRDTVIGAGSRLDNLVQIGHNVRLGRGCVIVAQVGISGSTTLGDYVMVAGQAGLTGHLDVGSRARIGAQAGVMADVPAGESVMGSPCQPVRQYFRELATLRRLARRDSARGRTVQGDAAEPVVGDEA
jgi:UDP-3-O-[3-hydroxymyristoyl] glucosamine N-acyltransferase